MTAASLALILAAASPAPAEELAPDFIRAGRWFVMRTPRETWPAIGTLVDVRRLSLTYEDVSSALPRVFLDAVEDHDAAPFVMRGSELDEAAGRLGLEPARDIVELRAGKGLLFSADPVRVRRNVSRLCHRSDPRLSVLLRRPGIHVVSKVVIVNDLVLRERSESKEATRSDEGGVPVETVETSSHESSSTYRGDHWMTLLFDAVPAAELGLEALLREDGWCGTDALRE